MGLTITLACGCAGTRASPPRTALAVDIPARPAIDYAFDSLDERPVSATAMRGKVTVLVFVTTSSLSAQAQVDFLVAMSKNDGDRINYAVVAIDPSEDREIVELYRKALSIPFPVAVGGGQTAGGGGPFGDVTAVPVTVILDRAGRLVSRMGGRVVRGDELRAEMRGL